jgi:uncharacterized protein involved in propanediol utilization
MGRPIKYGRKPVAKISASLDADLVARINADAKAQGRKFSDVLNAALETVFPTPSTHQETHVEYDQP